MSEEERQAIIHLLDKQARYEYCIKNNISFSDEDYEAYIIRQSMINKDKEIKRLNNIINELEHDFESYELEYLQGTYQGSLADFIETELERIQELKGSDKE